MKKKQIWGFVPAVMYILIAIAGLSIYLSGVGRSLWMHSVSDVLEVSAQGGHSFEVFISEEMKNLDRIADILSKSASTDEDTVHSILNIFSDKDYNYTAINLGNGCVYSDSREGFSKLTDEELAVYAGLEGSGVREPYIHEYTGLRTLSCYKRFTFADGVECVVQKSEPANDVAREFLLSFYNDTGFSYVVNDDGDILIRSTHKNSNRTFLNIFDVIELENDDKQVVDEFRGSINEGNSGAVQFTFSGAQYIFAYVPIGGTDNWHIVSIVLSSSVTEYSNHIMRISQIFVVLILVILLFAAIYTMMQWQNWRNMRELDQEIKYREQLFNILAVNTDEVFLMLSTDKYLVDYISPNVERLLGVPQDEVRKDIMVLGVNEDIDGNKIDYKSISALKPGDSISYESRRVHKKSGETRYFAEMVYSVTLDDTDKLIVAMLDCTEDMRNKQALEEALEIARVANASKSTFLSNMSHDIRTPMNAIVGLCTLLHKDADNPERVREHTAKITASSGHLLGLVNDILDMSKIESGNTTLNISEMSLAEIVTDIETIIRPQAKARHQSFEISVHDVKDERLMGDKLRVNQVLINIISNAVKYTQEGGSIRFAIYQIPQSKTKYAHFRFIVSDNGIGISEEYLQNIFKPFTREISSTTNSIMGTGLGMSITKNLVDLMGGTIEVESLMDEGSTFTVDLEFHICDVDADSRFWEDNEISRVLVVGMDSDTYNGIKGTATDAGLEFVTAGTGEGAQAESAKAHEAGRDYEVILIDSEIADMSFTEAAARIRQAVSPAVPFILLEKYDDEEIAPEALAGIDGSLSKPFFLSNLMNTLRYIKNGRMEAEEDKDEAPSVFEGRHFLVVEDNELNYEILEELLEMVGADCDVAVNGKEGVDKFNASKVGEYDAVFMDVHMPIMNGYDATRAIRAGSHPSARTIPIIAMSANAFVEDVKEALDSGMNAHVAKPVDMKKLEEALRENLKDINKYS